MQNIWFFRALLILPLFFLMACATIVGVDPQNELEVNEEVSVEWDPFKNLTVYKGPIISNTFEGGASGPEVEDLSLWAQRVAGKPDRIFLVLSDYYDGDWRGFDQAYDFSGRKFHALSVRHKVNCKLICGYEEVIEIQLDRDYLQSHQSTGMTFRLYGPSGQSSAPFEMPGAYIRGFLKGAYAE
jgi:hypothetical protein